MPSTHFNTLVNPPSIFKVVPPIFMLSIFAYTQFIGISMA